MDPHSGLSLTSLTEIMETLSPEAPGQAGLRTQDQGELAGLQSADRG